MHLFNLNNCVFRGRKPEPYGLVHPIFEQNPASC